jgi:hypothetical protein
MSRSAAISVAFHPYGMCRSIYWRAVRRPGVCLCALLVCLPATAHAQSGVRADPDSPAGVEYQIPLERARHGGGGTAGADAAPGVDAGAPEADVAGTDLFGAGIEPRATERRRAHEGGASGRKEGERVASEQSASSVPAKAQLAVGVGVGDGGASALTTGAVALGVIALGGVVGLLLRRALRDPRGG